MDHLQGAECQGHLSRSVHPLLRPQLEPEPRKCSGDAGRRWRGKGWNESGRDPQRCCTRAKNRIRSHHSFRSAWHDLPKVSRVPDPRLGCAGDTAFCGTHRHWGTHKRYVLGLPGGGGAESCRANMSLEDDGKGFNSLPTLAGASQRLDPALGSCRGPESRWAWPALREFSVVGGGAGRHR